MSATPKQEIANMNQSHKKVVRPVELSEGGGAQDGVRKLQAVEIQELSTIGEDGEPILRKLQAGDSVMVEGGKSSVGVAVIQEVRWSAAKRDVELCVVPLLRTAEIANSPSENLREVFYSHETTQILARKVMHPCKVWFLATDGLPVTLSGSGKSRHERYRAGFLCRQVALKQGKRFLPLAKLPASSPMFPEVAKLVQNTNKELRTLEDREGVPIGKRTGFPPPQFLPKEGKMGLSLDLSSPPSSPPPTAKHSTATSGLVITHTDTAADKPAPSAKPITAAAPPGPPRAAKSKGQADLVAGSAPAGSGGKLEAGTSKAAGLNSWDADVISEAEGAANNVAMSLELGAVSANAWTNTRSNIDVLLHCAGTTAEAVDNPSRLPVKRLKKHLLKAARQSVRLPALKVVERLAKAVNQAPDDTQEQLGSHGLHRVLGAWLCCLPSSSPGPVRVALLRALRKAPFVEATLYWVVRYGIFAHVCQLMEAPQQAVKEQAIALKVYWQDANEKLQPPTPQKLAPGADAEAEAVASTALPSSSAVSPPAVAQQQDVPLPGATAESSDEEEAITQRLAKRPKKQSMTSAGVAASTASPSYLQTGQAQPSANGRPASKAVSLGAVRSIASGDSLSSRQTRTGEKKRRWPGPEGTSKKTRTADDVHKTPPASAMPHMIEPEAAPAGGESSAQKPEDVSSPPVSNKKPSPTASSKMRKTDEVHRASAKSPLPPAYPTAQDDKAKAAPQTSHAKKGSSEAAAGPEQGSSPRTERLGAGGTAAAAAVSKADDAGQGGPETSDAGRSTEVVQVTEAAVDNTSHSSGEKRDEQKESNEEGDSGDAPYPNHIAVYPVRRPYNRYKHTARKSYGHSYVPLARRPASRKNGGDQDPPQPQVSQAELPAGPSNATGSKAESAAAVSCAGTEGDARAGVAPESQGVAEGSGAGRGMESVQAAAEATDKALSDTGERSEEKEESDDEVNNVTRPGIPNRPIWSIPNRRRAPRKSYATIKAPLARRPASSGSSEDGDLPQPQPSLAERPEGSSKAKCSKAETAAAGLSGGTEGGAKAEATPKNLGVAKGLESKPGGGVRSAAGQASKHPGGDQDGFAGSGEASVSGRVKQDAAKKGDREHAEATAPTDVSAVISRLLAGSNPKALLQAANKAVGGPHPEAVTRSAQRKADKSQNENAAADTVGISKQGNAKRTVDDSRPAPPVDERAGSKAEETGVGLRAASTDAGNVGPSGAQPEEPAKKVGRPSSARQAEKPAKKASKPPSNNLLPEVATKPPELSIQAPKPSQLAHKKAGTSKDRPSETKGHLSNEKASQKAPAQSAKEVGRGAAGEGAEVSGRRAAGPTKNALLVDVFVGVNKRRREGRFNVSTHKVTNARGEILTAQQFVSSAERKGPWQENIMVTGDPQGRAIREWLEDCCTVCKLPHDGDKMLMCSNEDCELLWHIYCLTPPLPEVPPTDEDWFCPECISKGKMNA